jgi:hypothetical protein
MFEVAKRTPQKGQPDIVVTVTPEWRQRVLEAIAQRPRGEHTKLARAIGCSTGTLTELLAEGEDPRASRYSRYVEPINEYFKLPSMLPISPDTLEIAKMLEGMSMDGKDLIRRIRDMPPEEQKAILLLIRPRSIDE